ncbi:MAG: hypothetical protein JWQ27_407 [Ferruginibacter sp.]|nr:hypothetical protein [Ferruginibacter sp.]
MKLRLLFFFTALSVSSLLSAQSFSGQWKGQFVENSSGYTGWGGETCEYVLDLDCRGTVITGFSYTYFTDGGKKYYTICKVRGTLNLKAKTLQVTEIERTKTNVPVEISNCFQVHTLSYSKDPESDGEILQGKWAPAPNQAGSCGFGLTSLKRRALKSAYPNFNNSTAKSVPVKKKPVVVSKTAIAKNTAPVVNKKTPEKPQPKLPDNLSILSRSRDTFSKQEQQPVVVVTPKINMPLSAFEKRNTAVLKTIEVENKIVKVDLYDNGEIDGDSISLFYNKALLVSRKRLTDKPLSLTIEIDGNVNELVMYAENLGTIPPNTALMVVTDGNKRYEVRITSDLQKSGTIRFIQKAVKQP